MKPLNDTLLAARQLCAACKHGNSVWDVSLAAWVDMPAAGRLRVLLRGEGVDRVCVLGQLYTRREDADAAVEVCFC